MLCVLVPLSASVPINYRLPSSRTPPFIFAWCISELVGFPSMLNRDVEYAYGRLSTSPTEIGSRDRRCRWATCWDGMVRTIIES